MNGIFFEKASREEVIRLYVYWFPTHLLMAMRELAGKDLVCYCAPLQCHGDWLLEQANRWLQR